MNIISGSAVAKPFVKLYGAVSNAFDNSCFKKCTVTLFKNSVFYKLCVKYYNKDSLYKNSLCYVLVNGMAKVADKLANGFGKWLCGICNGSVVCNAMRDMVEKDLSVAAFFVTTMGAGVGSAVIALVKDNSVGMMLGLGIFGISLLCFLLCRNIAFVKESLIFRFFVWLVK